MGKVKTLLQVVSALDLFDPEDTIYAVGPWDKDAQAMVAHEPENGGLPEEAETRGMKYFLEIFVARDFVEDWKASSATTPTFAEICERLIQYAIRDA